MLDIMVLTELLAVAASQRPTTAAGEEFAAIVREELHANLAYARGCLLSHAALMNCHWVDIDDDVQQSWWQGF